MTSPELEVPSPEDKKDFRSDNHLQIQSMLLVFCHIDCMWNVIVCACIAATETDMEGLLKIDWIFKVMIIFKCKVCLFCLH